MKALNPAQIPARPQPNLSDNQVSGRNPMIALATVTLRMKVASPAPSSTPSSANTTPATGNCATRNHHGTPMAFSTAGSSVNTAGITVAPIASSAAKPAAATAEMPVTRQATCRACPESPPPSAAPTSDCAAIASESSTSARNAHS